MTAGNPPELQTRASHERLIEKRHTCIVLHKARVYAQLWFVRHLSARCNDYIGRIKFQHAVSEVRCGLMDTADL